ncbi:MAG TPA: pyridoxal-phosphate dependent enzyme [Acidimicrobiia bacterium]|nr:pyridoxal-phosphate dependent enzyme [Acidimicrobiia bacterium]
MIAFEDVEIAQRRLAPFVHRTPVMTSHSLDEWLDTNAFLKCEHLQRCGAFKYRGATNAVQSLAPNVAARGVAAHSSGNHGAALALAARTRGIPAHIVVPRTATRTKRDAIAAYGAHVVLCEPTLAAREAGVAAVIAETGAVEIHPFDHDDVIAGAGTAALELVDDVPGLDIVIAPVGGGGLLSGTAIAAHGRRPELRVIGAEPAAADDAARSLQGGAIVPPDPPATIADGLLTGLSARTFAVLSEHVETIVTVSEAEIVAAMDVVWQRTKQLIEPSAAVAVAAVREGDYAGARVGIILSGGNADLALAAG